MKITTKIITPYLAEKMLDKNSRNRNTNSPTVLRYSDDMSSGRWRNKTGESIKFSKSGDLLDGQHRLMAVIHSDTPIEFLVVTDIDDDRFDVIDTGKPRSASDIFSIEGIPYSNATTAIITKYDLIKNLHTGSAQKNNRLTNRELLEEYYSRESFWENIITDTNEFYKDMAQVLPKSTIGGFYALFLDYNSSEAISFMIELTTGNDVSNGTINLLRRILIQDKVSLRKMSARAKDAIIIKTWNCYLDNKEFKRLSFNESKESYPVIKKQ